MKKKLFICLLLLLSQVKTTNANEIQITKIVNKSESRIRLIGSLLVPMELDSIAPGEEITHNINYSRLDERIIYFLSQSKNKESWDIIHRIFYKDGWIQDKQPMLNKPLFKNYPLLKKSVKLFQVTPNSSVSLTIQKDNSLLFKKVNN